MKKDVLKIVLLVVIFATTSLIMTQKVIKNPQDPNWEYVKNRVFDGETSVFRKSKGPILFELHEATKSDSLVVKEVITDLKKLLPNKKIAFFNTFVGKPLSSFLNRGKLKNPLDSINGYKLKDIKDSHILLSFEPSSLYKNKGNDFIQLGQGYSIQSRPFERIDNKITRNFPLTIVSIGDIFSFDQKKNYLMIGVLRNLVFLQNDSNVDGHSVFASKEITGLDNRILDRDIFLLQKLYSDDFFEQFKTYLTNTYSWRYYSLFLNKKLNKIQVISSLCIIGSLVFILLFSYFEKRKFKNSFLNYFLPICATCIYFIHFLFLYNYLTFNGYFQQIHQMMEYVIPLTLMDIISRILFIPSIIALVISLSLWLIEKNWVQKIKNFNFQLINKTFFTFLFFNTPIFLLPNIISNLEYATSYIPVFIFTGAISIGRGLLIYLNHFSDSLVKEKDVELSKLKEANTQSELKLLQSHINPHFLYNALNSIAGLAHSNPDKTEKMALSLSNLFRYSINKKGQKMSTVKEEVLMVENYLEIEKIRFGDRLKFTLNIDETLENEEIPMYILQPLVENAIKHGISEIRGEGLITLEIKKELANLLIIVSDNGPSFPNGLVSGHGLQTVYDLLRLSYGDKASLKWENTPVKQISISITKG
ncbi:histidine kinase [Wenyingzhuangia sp. chi5]|uniref:Histidine kinase n=1 Tax=Wenyingzhuangia gilva TaxID=3057677 RepID=A0ABT8VTD8_9FLAO|nr:histidine kinase [Wenyingzhuangia sp. chi5]MDO3695236.1 histidine kinase [Wenyingzhuangia sp. chi5]